MIGTPPNTMRTGRYDSDMTAAAPQANNAFSRKRLTTSATALALHACRGFLQEGFFWVGGLQRAPYTTHGHCCRKTA
eukprot:6487500-Amphidinium_carterae.1